MRERPCVGARRGDSLGAFENERSGVEWIDGSHVGFVGELVIIELLEHIDRFMNPIGFDLIVSDR